MLRVLMAVAAVFALLTPACATPAEPASMSAPAASPSGPAAAPATTEAPTSLPASVPIAGSIWYGIVPDQSEARYRVREQLAGLSFPNDAVGATKSISGNIVLAPNGSVLRDQSVITIDLNSLKSDSGQRDNYVRSSVLVTRSFPNTVFRPAELKGLPFPLPVSGQATFQMIGELTVKGVTKPTAWDVTASFTEGGVTGSAKTTTRWEEFGISRPRVARVLSVADTFALEFDFHLQRGG